MNGLMVRRWLKVVDPTAITARETLQRALAYGRAMEAVHRSEVLLLQWGGKGSRGPVEALANKTNLFYNPNKHFVEFAQGSEQLSPPGNVWVLVATPGDGASLAATVKRRSLLQFPIDLACRGTLWALTIDADESARRKMAEEIATTEARHRGLLGNPHFQFTKVFMEKPKAAQLAEAMEAAQHISDQVTL